LRTIRKSVCWLPGKKDEPMKPSPFLTAAVLAAVALGAVADEPQPATDDLRRYTFSWQFTAGDPMRPRGGTSRGAPVVLDTAPTREWQALQEPGLDKRERDRRAILAMAGSYRTTFDFIETVGFVAGYEPPAPYQSWSTEHVRVIEDRGDFISLQHLLVMFFVGDDGAVSAPIVTKHWRQDWQYEDRDLHQYAGHDRWQHRRASAEEARGKWSQAVFQVDDSPRYETLGEWRHDGSDSSWSGAPTWRPLPRREYSVRDDYHALVAVNRHTILPSGWVHEEDNLKLVLDAAGAPAAQVPYLARELGVNRYDRLAQFDASAGERYWQSTRDFWHVVRAAWADVYAERERFELVAAAAGEAPLLFRMLQFAEEIAATGAYEEQRARGFVSATLREHVR
jgi:hypothetical protein